VPCTPIRVNCEDTAPPLPYLAWAFVEAVHHAIRSCPQAKQFYDRRAAKRNGALATKALAAKWTKAAYYMMKRQEAFDLKRVFG